MQWGGAFGPGGVVKGAWAVKKCCDALLELIGAAKEALGEALPLADYREDAMVIASNVYGGLGSRTVHAKRIMPVFTDDRGGHHPATAGGGSSQ